MPRLVPTGAFANETLAQSGSVRGGVTLVALVVAVVAFAVVRVLARMAREAVAISMRLLAAALTAAAIGVLAVILIGMLLIGTSVPVAHAAGTTFLLTT